MLGRPRKQVQQARPPGRSRPAQPPDTESCRASKAPVMGQALTRDQLHRVAVARAEQLPAQDQVAAVAGRKLEAGVHLVRRHHQRHVVDLGCAAHSGGGVSAPPSATRAPRRTLWQGPARLRAPRQTRLPVLRSGARCQPRCATRRAHRRCAHLQASHRPRPRFPPPRPQTLLRWTQLGTLRADESVQRPALACTVRPRCLFANASQHVSMS